jgi:prefoldin subunit 5
LKHYDFENASSLHTKDEILTLLTNSSLKDIYKKNPKLNETVKEVIINSVSEKDFYNFMIFVYRFDESLVFDNRIKDKFIKIKQELFAHLTQNSTSTESVIKSLILGFHFLNNDEVEKFFAGLNAILKIRDDGKRYMIFTYAYEHVNHLRYIYKELVLEQWQKEKIKNELIQISEIYKANWKYAIGEKENDKEFELIFTEFSIPSRLKINETIVFNWAYSSVYLAHFLQDIDWLFDILRELKAKKRDSYKPYLKALVRELSFLENKTTLITQNLIEMIREFDAIEQFYTSMPSLIANLSNFKSEESKQILEELTKKIFTYGPDKNDIGVFIQLLKSDIEPDMEKFKKYKQRLMNMKEEYELIYPYFAALEFKYNHKDN